MIEISVTKADDDAYLGTWRFPKNQVYLGYPEGDIAPRSLAHSFLFLVEIVEGQLQVEPHPKLEFWLLNGKRATKARRVRPGDLLRVADVEFKILAAQESEVRSKKQILDARLKALVSQEAPVLSLVQLLNPKTKA